MEQGESRSLSGAAGNLPTGRTAVENWQMRFYSITIAPRKEGGRRLKCGLRLLFYKLEELSLPNLATDVLLD